MPAPFLLQHLIFLMEQIFQNFYNNSTCPLLYYLSFLVMPIEERDFWDKMRRGCWDKLNSREKFLAKLYTRTSACTETAFTPQNKEIASIFEREAENKNKLLHEVFNSLTKKYFWQWLNFLCTNCELHSIRWSVTRVTFQT